MRHGQRMLSLGTFGLGVIAIGVAMAANASAGPIKISVFTTLAPNIAGAASFPAWQANAITSLTQALATAGTPGAVGTGGPTQFQVQSSVDARDLTVTSFNSWLGTADPASVFGPAFANEYGNRGHFPLYINGNGTQFSISQLTFSGSSSDAGNLLAFSYAAGDYNYNAAYIGVLAGADGIVGTADDTYTTDATPNTQLVDALIGRGSGNALWPCAPGDPTPCSTTIEQQAAINATASYLYGKKFTGTYSIGAVSGSASFDVASPEPSTFGLIGLSGFALLAARRRLGSRA